jgi:hypothetical protein
MYWAKLYHLWQTVCVFCSVIMHSIPMAIFVSLLMFMSTSIIIHLTELGIFSGGVELEG